MKRLSSTGFVMNTYIKKRETVEKPHTKSMGLMKNEQLDKALLVCFNLHSAIVDA